MRSFAAAVILSMLVLTVFLALQKQSAGSGKQVWESETLWRSSHLQARPGPELAVSEPTSTSQPSARKPGALVEQGRSEQTRHPSLVDGPASAAHQIRDSPREATVDPDLPWAHPGQCLDTSGASARQRYLASFEIRDPQQRLFVASGTPELDVEFLRGLLRSTHELATRELGLEAAPPAVYLHSSVASLREHACVAPSAVAYYDGAIHLAPLEPRHEIKTSLRHEYVHHVLAFNGVGKPVWLHEGAAMDFARDATRGQHSIWVSNPIDLERMVEPISPTASAKEVEIYYAHAAVMFEFLDRLCLGRRPCLTAELVNALTQGDVAPDDLFLWATDQRGNELIERDALSFWLDYESHHNFRPEILNRLLARAHSSQEEQDPPVSPGQSKR